jgi:uncharacterized protein (TIGR00730 family)
MRICIFSGSNPGRLPEYFSAAQSFGAALAEAGIGLVYGGASVGLMGAAADAALSKGGEAIGVIPQSLVDKELAHKGLTEQHVTTSMHERKALMAELSDGFVALPGGVGTLEELFEVWTWAQLGFHKKPVGLLNIAGFYNPLIAFLDHVSAEQFMKPQHRGMLLVESEPEKMIAAMKSYEAPVVTKWIGRSDT